jgi:hypothetical protein
MEALGAMMEKGAEEACGPRHGRGDGRRGHRWGHVRSAFMAAGLNWSDRGYEGSPARTTLYGGQWELPQYCCLSGLSIKMPRGNRHMPLRLRDVDTGL